MKIVSFNLAGYSDWESRGELIVTMLDDQHADIILLQEVKFDPVRSGFSQAIEINNSLKMPYEYTTVDVTKYYRPSFGESFREGLAVLSRSAILSSETLVLDQAEDDRHPRIVQLIDLRVGGEVIKIANVHFSNNKYSVVQLGELLAILESRREQRIIAGDFNILTVEQVREMTKEKYRLAYDSCDYRSFVSKGLTLDHVIIPAGWEFGSIEAVDNMSDHSAVICEIKEEV